VLDADRAPLIGWSGVADAPERTPQLRTEGDGYGKRGQQSADDEALEKQYVDPGHLRVTPSEMRGILSQVGRRRQPNFLETLHDGGVLHRVAIAPRPRPGAQRVMTARMRRGLLLLAGSLVASACTRRPTPVVAGAIPEGLDAFLATHPLAAGQPVRADEIGRSTAASWHIVQIAGSETPHRHRLHDLSVFLLRGEGVLTLDGRRIPLRAGDASLVARDHPHWFAHTGPGTSVTLVVFSPPLDAPDLVPEQEVDSKGGRR
jgi:mannose-6-phosphate isomerase-like protein (cupin superfamily)